LVVEAPGLLIQAVQEAIPYFLRLHQLAVAAVVSLALQDQMAAQVVVVQELIVRLQKLEAMAILQIHLLHKVAMADLDHHQQALEIETPEVVAEHLQLAQLLTHRLAETVVQEQHHQLLARL
jgi:hypothetical protein